MMAASVRTDMEWSSIRVRCDKDKVDDKTPVKGQGVVVLKDTIGIVTAYLQELMEGTETGPKTAVKTMMIAAEGGSLYRCLCA